MPFEQLAQYQKYLQNADNNRKEIEIENKKNSQAIMDELEGEKDFQEDINILMEVFGKNDIKALMKEFRKKVEETDINSFENKLRENKLNNVDNVINYKNAFFNKDSKKNYFIWKKIHTLLNSSRAKDDQNKLSNNADAEAVWKAHLDVLNCYIAPLYESLGSIDFDKFLKKIGLTKNVANQNIYATRIFHLIRRMTIKDNADNSRYQFPIPDEASEKETFKMLNKTLRDWVSNTLSRCENFPENLPNWTIPTFQVYLGYEALFIYLYSINKELTNDIEPFNFYHGLCDWMGHSNTGKPKDISTSIQNMKWTQVLDFANQNDPNYSIIYLAIFSKAIHIFLGKGEETCTQEEEKRHLFFSSLHNEIRYLQPEDNNEILKKVLKGMEIFANNAKKVQKEELGTNKRGNIPEKWCESSLCRFLTLKYCQYIYDLAHPQDKELQEQMRDVLEQIRDVLVKPLSNESPQRNKMKNILEGGRKKSDDLDEIIALVDNAVLPEFRDIWEILDYLEIEDD
jgi:ssRNA-specific RNase YbeY (16S rRNA maturation enzyme)